MTTTLIICNILNTLIIFDFLRSIYAPKYNNNYIYITSMILFYVIHVAVNLQQIAILNMLFETIILQITAHFLFNSISCKNIYNLFFSLYLIFTDMISFAIMLRCISWFNIENLSYDEQYAICVAFQYILLLLTYKFTIKLLHKTSINCLPTYQNLFFPLLALFEIIVTFYVWHLNTPTSNNILILMCTGFMALDFYLVYMFCIVHQQTIRQGKLNLERQQRILLDTNIRNIERQYRESSKLIHDVRGHLNALDQLYAQGQNESANNLRQQLEVELNKLDIGFFTASPLLNVVLYDRLCTAKAKNIKMDFLIQNDIDLHFMDEIDITTLFTNLLNNAIEACEAVSTGRFIELKIGQIHNAIVINCRNAYLPQNLKLCDDKYLSTKPNHFGIGISNIKSIIEKYNGAGEWIARSDAFAVELFLTKPPKENELYE